MRPYTSTWDVENRARLSRIARLLAEHEAVSGTRIRATCNASPAMADELNRLTDEQSRHLEEEHQTFAQPVPGVQYNKFTGANR